MVSDGSLKGNDRKVIVLPNLRMVCPEVVNG